MNYQPSDAEVAVNNLDLEALRAALDAGSDVNERLDDGTTLLMFAIDSEACLLDDNVPLRVDCTALLLARGADTTLTNHKGEGWYTWAKDRHWLAIELVRAWEARGAAVQPR